MSNTSTLTDRAKAVHWWRNQPLLFRAIKGKEYFGVVYRELDSEEEIETIWRKETSSTPTSTESGELKCTKGHWRSGIDGDVITDNVTVAVLPHLKMDDIERKANSNLIAASKDIYNALKGIIDDWDSRSGGDKEEYKTSTDGPMKGYSYWSPAGRMIKSEFIAKAREAIAKANPQ